MGAESGDAKEVPGAGGAMTGTLAGEFSKADLPRLASKQQLCGMHRVARQAQVLRENIAGSEGQNADRSVGAGDALDYVEHGSIATADEDGVKTGCNGFPSLVAGRAGGECLLQLDLQLVGTEQGDDLLDGGLLAASLFEERVNEQHDFPHGPHQHTGAQ